MVKCNESHLLEECHEVDCFSNSLKKSPEMLPAVKAFCCNSSKDNLQYFSNIVAFIHMDHDRYHDQPWDWMLAFGKC